MRLRTLSTLVLSILIVSLLPMNDVRGQQQGGDLPQPLPLFPRTNWWNLNISTAPVDTNSDAFIQFIGPARGLHPDFGGDVSQGSVGIYGFPYIVVSGSQRMACDQLIDRHEETPLIVIRAFDHGYAVELAARQCRPY